MKKNQLRKLLESAKDKVRHLKQKVEQLKASKEEEYEEAIKEPRKPHEGKTKEIEITFNMASVAKATIVVLVLILLSNFIEDIGEVILVFFISILFAAALDPTVDKLEEYKIPRALSVMFIYVILLSVLGLFISQLIPLVASQIIELAKRLQDLLVVASNEGASSSIPFYDQISSFFEELVNDVDRDVIVNQLKESLESIGNELQSIAGNTLAFIVKIFNGIFNFVLVLILTFFLIVDERGVDKFFISLFPSKHGKYIVEKIEAVKHKVGFWLRGQIILMFVMFFLTLIGLLILKVDYALTLAMLAGIAELVPVVGPIIAGVPALLVAFNQSSWLALWVLIMILILQQLEGNLIVPIVMKKAVGLSPIIIILSMLIGFKTFGILGTIIAIPVATSLAIFVNDYASKKK